MFALAAFALLIPPALPTNPLPVGCIARFGDPRAENASTRPEVSPDGRFLLYDHRIIDTFTGVRYPTRDATGRDIHPPLHNEPSRMTAAGYYLTWEDWQGSRPCLPGMSPPWGVALFDYKTGKPKKLYRPPTGTTGHAQEFHTSPNGETVVIHWSIEHEHDKGRLYTPRSPADGFAVSTDSVLWMRIDLTGRWLFTTVGPDRGSRFHLYDAATGKRLLDADLGAKPYCNVCVSPDGKRVAVHGISVGLQVYDFDAGRWLWKRPLWANGFPTFHFSDDGKMLTGVTPQYQRRQWEANNGVEGKRVTLTEGKRSNTVTSEDRSTVIEAKDGQPLRVFDRRSTKLRFELPRHAGAYRLRAGNGMADFETEDGFVFHWNWKTGSDQKHANPDRDWTKWDKVFDTRTGRYQLRYADSDKFRGELDLFDTTTKTVIPIRYVPDDESTFVPNLTPTVGPTGLIANAGKLTTPGGNTRHLLLVVEPKSGRHLVEYELPDGHDGIACWFHPNRREVWLGLGESPGSYSGAGAYERGVIVLDLLTGTPKRVTAFPTGVSSFMGDRAGRLVAVDSSGGVGVTRVLDARTGKVVLSSASGHPVAFSADGRWVLTREQRLYDTSRPNRKPFVLPPSRFDPEQAVAFSPDSRQLLTGHENGCVHVWDLARIGEIIATHANRAEEVTAKAWEQLDSRQASAWEQAMRELLEFPEEVIRQVKQLPVVPPAELKAIRTAFAEIKAGGRNGEPEYAWSRLEKWCREGSRDLVAAVLKEVKPGEMSAIGGGDEFRRFVENFRLEEPPPPEEVFKNRLVELMERLGTPEAKAVLTTWAAGAPNARLTTEAKAAVGRLR